jgi:hypothetical protein
MESDFDQLLLRVSAGLDAAGVAHMLTGSFALAFYVHEFRATVDLDIVIDASDADVAAFMKLFPPGDQWYVSEDTVRDAIAGRRMFNVIQLATGIKLNFIQTKALELERLKLSRRRRMGAGAASFWIISPEDLLLSKLAWGMPSDSAVQMRDIRTLLRDHPDMDWDYVNHWADSIGVRDWLDQARSQ